MQPNKTQLLIQNKSDLFFRVSIAVFLGLAILALLFFLQEYKVYFFVVIGILAILILFYVDMFLIKRRIIQEVVESNVQQTNLLMDVKERVMDLDQTKVEFLSLAIHQLRAPLTGIQWALKMMLDGEMGNVSKEQRAFLSKSYESNTKALALLNEILNLDRTEPEKLKYNFAPSNVLPIIEMAVANVAPQAQTNNVHVVFDHSMTSVPDVMMDTEKINTVIENLLENSIKYTIGGGTVHIGIAVNDKTLEISIKDEGIGIPLKDQPNIFKRYYRAHNAIEMHTQGSGVGLFMVQRIIEKHGGKIWFESEENKGTTFHFTLPLH